MTMSLFSAALCGLWFAPASAEEAAAEAAEAAAPAEAAPVETTEAPADEIDMAKVSYALGIDVGRSLQKNFSAQGLELDAAKMLAGVKTGLDANAKSELTDTEIQDALYGLQVSVMSKQIPPQMLPELRKNWAADKAFLAENAKAEGVVTTESGLQYQIVEPGEGDAPKLGDTVKVNYHGTLVGGKVFDSSIEPPQPGRQAEPVEFQLGRVIPGWNEGLTHVKPGGKIKLFIPARLAYGLQGSPPVIGTNAALVFDVELLAVNPEPEPAPAPKAPEGDVLIEPAPEKAE